MKTLSVYIHIPFCLHKCNYCDFLSAAAGLREIDDYMEALKREILQQAKEYQDYEIQTVFLGGGTPSIVKAQHIQDILMLLHTQYHFAKQSEVTIEMNPATADFSKMKLWREAGVNRLSIGLQSCHDDELKLLGRVHTYADFLHTYEMARKAGFDNINIDLMSALPGQNKEKWEETLREVVDLNPEHISAYSLIVEEGTHLFEHLNEYPSIPTEEEDREMYQFTKQILREHGYERYEISNYAKSGYACKHNCVYWTRDNYVGFGLGAASMVDNVRWTNTRELAEYMQQEPAQYKRDLERLSTTDCMEEFMFLGLRMMEGISRKRFQTLFGQTIENVYQDVLQCWMQKGMLLQQGDRIFLSDQGIDISNVIFSDFLT